MFWVGGRKQLQKIKINRWAAVGKGLTIQKDTFDIFADNLDE
jgi:hypothetical protein